MTKDTLDDLEECFFVCPACHFRRATEEGELCEKCAAKADEERLTE